MNVAWFPCMWDVLPWLLGFRLKLVDDVVLDASALLNATGRVARTAGLDLEKAGIHGSAECGGRGVLRWLGMLLGGSGIEWD